MPGERTESRQLSASPGAFGGTVRNHCNFSGFGSGRGRNSQDRNMTSSLYRTRIFSDFSEHSSPKNMPCRWKCNCTGLKKWKEGGAARAFCAREGEENTRGKRTIAARIVFRIPYSVFKMYTLPVYTQIGVLESPAERRGTPFPFRLRFSPSAGWFP